MIVGLRRKFAKILRLAAIAVLVGYLVAPVELNVFSVPHLPRPSSDHVTNRTCKPLLCLFTTFRPGNYKIPVRLSVIIVIKFNSDEMSIEKNNSIQSHHTETQQTHRHTLGHTHTRTIQYP